MTLSFTEADIPATVSTRASEANPFVDEKVFPRDEKAISLTVNGAKDSAEVKKVVSQARAAAILVERTARVKYVDGPKGKTTMLIWTVPPIKRPRKTDESAAE